MSSFSHIAGDPLLDLINTVEWRLSPDDREEDLGAYGQVLDWCAESGLTSGDETDALRRRAASAPADAEAERVRVIGLREDAYRALFEQDAAAAGRLADAHRDALSHAELARAGAGWRWSEPELTLATPRHRIARGLIDLLGRDDLDRLHQCEDAKCGWVFLDTSPRRNRRWCVTKDCGDRNRARAYYRRKKQQDAAG